MLVRRAVTMAALLVVPVLCFLIALWTIHTVDVRVPENMTSELACQTEAVWRGTRLEEFCNKLPHAELLRSVSIWSGFAIFALFVLYVGAAVVAGRSRSRISFVFPKLVPFTSISIAALVIVQAAMLPYAVYAATGRLILFVIIPLALAALVTSLNMAAVCLHLIANAKLVEHLLARRLAEDDAPRLCGLVRDVANRLGAEIPKNFIVGLEPSCFATAAKIRLVGEENVLKGETLYLSLPLLRVFSLPELTAVIGHELGHFRGQDTIFSKRFAPVYRGLSTALVLLADESAEYGVSRLLKKPPLATLSLMLDAFAVNERRISRERELAADRAAVEVAGATALATALAKSAIYAVLWSRVHSDSIRRLKEGWFDANLSEKLASTGPSLLSLQDTEDLQQSLHSVRIAHPTDSHPPLSERLVQIGVDPAHLTIDTLAEVQVRDEDVPEKLVSIERELTLAEYHLSIAFGALDDDDGQAQTTGDLPNAVYSLTAAMIATDGAVEPGIMEVAAKLGGERFKGFSSEELKAACDHVGELPAFEDLADILGLTLRRDHTERIRAYLGAVTESDRDLRHRISASLEYLDAAWELRESTPVSEAVSEDA